MRNKKIGVNTWVPGFLALALLLCLAPNAAAGGKREARTEAADGTGIWQKVFDVSTLKPGRYNILVRAKDAAGNEGLSGPFNITIDPLAGLPSSRVVYPLSALPPRHTGFPPCSLPWTTSPMKKWRAKNSGTAESA